MRENPRLKVIYASGYCARVVGKLLVVMRPNRLTILARTSSAALCHQYITKSAFPGFLDRLHAVRQFNRHQVLGAWCALQYTADSRFGMANIIGFWQQTESTNQNSARENLKGNADRPLEE